MNTGNIVESFSDDTLRTSHQMPFVQSLRAEKAPATLIRTTLQKQLATTATENSSSTSSNQKPKYSQLQESGVRVAKITSRGRFRMRTVVISPDFMSLFCRHRSSTRRHRSRKSKRGGEGLRRIGAMLLGKPAPSNPAYAGYIDLADLDSIHEGVLGTQAWEAARYNYPTRNWDNDKAMAITICHHGNQTLDLEMGTKKDLDNLVSCLRQMQSIYHQVKQSVGKEALLLRYIWFDVDVNRDGTIEQKELVTILGRINLYCRNATQLYQEYMQKLRLESKIDKSGLRFPEVMTYLQRLKNQPGKSLANQLWDKFFGSEVDSITAEQFLKFLHEQQNETKASMQDAETLVAVLNAMEVNYDDRIPTAAPSINSNPTSVVLGRSRFEAYLHHDMNDAYDPFAQEHDSKTSLDKPISYYWINTSHNTYLTGDQLQSKGSVEMYARALQRGCKCLELDCYDSEKKSSKSGVDIATPGPVVYHGHTLTSKVAFADIVAVVRSYMDEHRYKTYPIILSLENHCSPPFQQAMASILENTLQDYLYIPTAHDKNGTDVLPSPKELRGKVVVKGKRPPDPEDETSKKTNIDSMDGDDDVDPYDASGNSPKGTKKSEHGKIVKDLARLTLFHGTKYKEFEVSIEEPKSHMHSIGETKIYKILSKRATNTDLWRQYNVEHMTRTYPAGSRVDSSNYNPTLAWFVGCQLVALNFQTTDTPLILNDGRFRVNDRCGYIEKPPSIIGPKVSSGVLSSYVPEPKTTTQPPSSPISHSYPYLHGDPTGVVERMISQVPHEQARPYLMDLSQPRLFKVRILSGSCLPKPHGAKVGESIDPFVSVTVHDVKLGNDGKPSFTSSSYSTGVVSDNGFCPVWSELSFHDFVITSPSVASVEFSLTEADLALHDKIGDASIPVSSLRAGYRSIQLYDKNNTRTGPFDFATILVEIRFENA